MQTKKPRLAEMACPFYIDERRDCVARGSDRSPRGTPLAIGNVVVLYFVSPIVGRDGRHFTQPLRCRVTARHKYKPGMYRAELIESPDRQLFDPRRDLCIGQPVVFTNANVVFAGK